MKNVRLAFVIGFLLILFLVFLSWKDMNDISNLRRQVKKEHVMTDFALNSLNKGEAVFDSCYLKGDTAFFYKNGVFQGKSVIATEEHTEFSF